MTSFHALKHLPTGLASVSVPTRRRAAPTPSSHCLSWQAQRKKVGKESRKRKRSIKQCVSGRAYVLDSFCLVRVSSARVHVSLSLSLPPPLSIPLKRPLILSLSLCLSLSRSRSIPLDHSNPSWFVSGVYKLLLPIPTPTVR
jgi:hypothetical protein